MSFIEIKKYSLLIYIIKKIINILLYLAYSFIQKGEFSKLINEVYNIIIKKRACSFSIIIKNT